MSSSSCSHLSHPGSSIQTPPANLTRPGECSQCFDSQDNQDGVDICLGCYNAGCPRLHAQAHADKFGGAHALVVNIRRVRKQQSDTATGTSAKRVGLPLFRMTCIVMDTTADELSGCIALPPSLWLISTNVCPYPANFVVETTSLPEHTYRSHPL